MSTEKLSELSKPVAWTSARSLDVRRKVTAFTDVESAAEYASANCWEKIVPLYSQEYVSALLAELEAKDERIGELEAIATDYADKFQKAQDALKYAAVMSDEDKKNIAELEKRLATPVRLPRTLWYEHDDLAHEIPVLEKKKVVAEIRAAGFKVEGDE
ncbi:hypothetical protein [Serratia marcescens]|uniref:hypothetical protein n=1 Tax=Serratia marcescens TaxID=615 RepID=UPI001E657459|nr:hypothetical protein [Serratia marcescens]